MNLPNSLTILRIFFTPLLVVVLLTRQPNIVFLSVPMNFAVWGVLILLLAAATDWADGFYARRREQVTTLGILLDPIADKLLISAAFISLVQLGLAPAWMVALIIGREFAITGLRSLAYTKGITIPASPLGKIKMATQVAAITLLILGMPGGSPYPLFHSIGRIALYVVVLFALWSAFDYFRRFWTQIDDRFKARERRRLILLQKRQRRQIPTRDVPTH